MAKQRYIDTAFWDDYYVSQLDPSEKLLFLYLLTNPCTNLIGVYQIPLKRIALDTGFDMEMIKKLMDRFAKDNKAFFEVGWVILKNAIKHQKNKSPKVAEGMKREWEAMPEWLQVRLSSEKDTLYIPYRYPMHTVSHSDLDLNLNLDLDSNAAKPRRAVDKNQQVKAEGMTELERTKQRLANKRKMQ